MLPLTLLKTSEGYSVLCELKNGETYNGKLVTCDQYMNMVIKAAICTSRDGSRFWKISKVYIKGNTIKYISMPEQIINLVKEEKVVEVYSENRRGERGRGRGGRGRGRGRGEHSEWGRGRGRGDSYEGGRGRGLGGSYEGGRGRGRGDSTEGGRGRGMRGRGRGGR